MKELKSAVVFIDGEPKFYAQYAAPNEFPSIYVVYEDAFGELVAENLEAEPWGDCPAKAKSAVREAE